VLGGHGMVVGATGVSGEPTRALGVDGVRPRGEGASDGLAMVVMMMVVCIYVPLLYYHDYY
jgi:hypothetical protein